MRRLIVFTDLDGTLLDADSYSWEAAKEALDKLRESGVPLILASSKTRMEIEPLRSELKNRHPFIVENGGAVFVPKGYFNFPLERSVLRGDYEVLELGIPYAALRMALKDIERESGILLRGFGDMSEKEIAERTGLSMAAAALARQREYDEPLVLDASPKHIQQLDESIQARGLCLVRAGRFYHLSGATDKGVACRYLSEAYKCTAALAGDRVVTVGVGDSYNDVPLLANVDRPILVQKPDGSYDLRAAIPGLKFAPDPGPIGWNRAVMEILGSH